MTPEEAKQFIGKFDPFTTVFYFNGRYHIVGNDDWLKEVSNEEAGQLLKSDKCSLWSIGDPPEDVPGSCPKHCYLKIPINCSVGEFLSMAFDLKFKQTIIDNVSKN